MADKKLNKDEKQEELVKYRDLVLATLDYYLDNYDIQIKTSDFDSKEHYEGLKIQTEEHYQKGRLTRLKQWFRDLTEMQVETRDLKFNKYLQDLTKYNIDIFKSYFQRVDEIIEKGKVTTDNQFYDINIMVDKLCQTEPVDNNKLEILNRLLSEYEQRKSKQTRKPTA
jgi:ERCC4-related helicase